MCDINTKDIITLLYTQNEMIGLYSIVELC